MVLISFTFKIFIREDLILFVCSIYISFQENSIHVHSKTILPLVWPLRI